jgi:four helix bundle protein
MGNPVDLKVRTRRYALDVIQFFSRLPKTTEAQILGKQFLRSGTSVGAHYREAIRAKSNADFISKMEGGLQELEETAYWLELLHEAQIATGTQPLQIETEQLIAIFVAMVKNAKSKG